MRRRSLLAALPPCLLAPPARAATGLVVVELFTSQSCSSCPPADDLLAELAGRPGVLALSWHVTYWNRLGWRDRFSLAEATERQRRYAITLGQGQVYTPQTVIQGRQDAVGSDRRAVQAAISRAAPAPVAVVISADAERVTVTVGGGEGSGALLLLGFDPRQVTPIGGGENSGRTLTHANVVRGVASLGAWDGAPARLSAARPTGSRLAALLQAADGAILGAASL